MNREKYNKSKTTLIEEVDSVYMQLATKIEAYGNIIRNTTQSNKDDLVGHMNKLKKDQFKLKQILVDVDGRENPEWDTFRKEAEKTTTKVKDDLRNEVPISI